MLLRLQNYTPKMAPVTPEIQIVNKKIVKMKYICAVLIFLVVSNKAVYSQDAVQLSTPDSTIQKYLENSTKDTTIMDSCIENVSYIKFNLNSKGELKAFTCSKAMPAAFKSVFKQRLEALKDKWDRKFLKKVTKNKITLLQPVFLYNHSTCLIRDNFYIKKMDTAEPGSQEYNTYLDKAMINLISYNLVSVKESFLKSFDFDSNEGFTNGSGLYLLTPCTISRKRTGRVFER